MRLRYLMFVLITAGQLSAAPEMRAAPTVFTATATPTPAPAPLASPTLIGSSIAYDQSVTGELTTLNPTQSYLLEGRGGDLIIASMDRVDGVIDPLLMIIDAKLQNVLAVDNDGGGDRNARLRYVLPADGTYVLRATSAQQGDLNGSYRLTVTLANPTPTPAPPPIQTQQARDDRLMPLLPGSTASDLTREISYRAYAFALRSGDTFRASVVADSALQVGLYVYTPAMLEVGRAELGAALQFTAAGDGAYLLIVSRISGNGTYTLSATLPQRLPTAFGAERLVPGQRQDGQIGARPGALYIFDASPGTRFDLSLNGPDLIGILAGPSYEQIAITDSGAMRNILLRENGTYLLLVMHQGGVNGFQPTPFTLTFRGEIDPAQVPTATPTPIPSETPTLPPGVTAATATMDPGAAFPLIAAGTALPGRTDPANPRQFFRFRGTAGQRVTIRMISTAGGTLDPLVYLYFYGQTPPLLVAGAGGAAPAGTEARISGVALPYDGVYVIIATGKDGSSGPFTLELTANG